MARLRRGVPGGVAFVSDGVTTTEMHVSTCAHCQRQTHFDSLKRMMDHVEICRGCMRLICLECHGKPCVPWEKRAEMMETAARRESSYNFLRDFERYRRQ